MTGNAQKPILGVIGLTITILALCATTTLAWQQEKISPLSDYQYKKDYAQVEDIKKETDPQKRADMLLAYVKEHPISRMLYYAASDFLECVKPYLQKKDWAKAISMEEAFLALVPSEKTVQAAGIPVGVEDFLKTQLVPTQKSLYTALMAAYFQSNNLPKAAEMGEKTYALSPDKTMIVTLSQIYLKMQNFDKYLAYGDKILANFPLDQAYGTALQMAQVYIQKQQVGKARELFTKLMDAYGEKTPPGVQESAWNVTRAISFSVIAAGFYEKKDYAKALELYEKAAKFDPKRDEAYYYIGMCKWNGNDQEGAIEPFAKAAVLGQNYAKRAQQYLEDLYKARHNDSLDGLNDVLAKARAELGVS